MKTILATAFLVALCAAGQSPYYISNSTGMAYTISNAFTLVNSNFTMLQTNKWPTWGTNASTMTSTSAVPHAGFLAWDTNYLYLSVGSNEWKRVAVTNF